MGLRTALSPPYCVFNLFLPASFLRLHVCDHPPSARSGKMSRTKHCGGLRMFGVFVARPAGRIKSRRRGGVSRKLGVSKLLSGRSSIQIHSSRTPGSLFTSSAPRPLFVILSPPCPALTTSQIHDGFQREPLHSSSRMRLSRVKSSGRSCLPSFHSQPLVNKS